ncbi:cleavage stimulating factor 64 isoform X3 [Wolffia australiana]
MASSSSQRRCVFVGNIPYDATEEQLVQICEEVGPVVSFRLVLDRETGKPKGYGFCEYKDEETALSARRNLHGYEINGRQLRVDFAENDKSADRGRELGRGGPGLASSSGAPSILGDSSLHQPIGQQLAVSAAATLAKALGEASQVPLGADPLTQYLSKMSRHQLSQVMTEMKSLATQNGPLARQLLQSSVQLPKALFQAQIILNMVTPQTLQNPNLRQRPSSSSSLALSQDGLEAQKPIPPPFHGQPHIQPGILAKLPEVPISGPGTSPLIPQPQLQPGPHLSHALMGKPGVQIFSQPHVGLTTSSLTSGLPSRGLLQQDRLIASVTGGVHSSGIIQQLPSGRFPPSQRIAAHLPGEPGSYSSPGYDSTWSSQVRISQDGVHLPKRPKLEETSSDSQIESSAAYRSRTDASLPVASQMIGGDGAPQFDKHAPQQQQMQKALLEQVKSLTAEQLSLLPPDQRQQVIDLQQRLRMLEGLDAAT